MDVYEECRRVVAALEHAGIRYALCGGLALAVHGRPRATLDIDLLVEVDELDRLRGLLVEAGFTHEALPMTFSKGRVQIRRLTKVDEIRGDVLPVDLVMVQGAVAERVWQSRERRPWEGMELWVVSRKGLAALKRLRGSTQDQADLEVLLPRKRPRRPRRRRR
jgi:hypothetical protein